MGLVRVHCWSCARSVQVDEDDTRAGLDGAGWMLDRGETYCPQCARARGLTASRPALEQAAGAIAPGDAASEAAAAAASAEAAADHELQPFGVSPYDSGESRMARSARMLWASFTVLRENPSLAVFPIVSLVLSLIVGIFCFGTWTPSGHGTGSAHDAVLVP